MLQFPGGCAEPQNGGVAVPSGGGKHVYDLWDPF